MTMGEVEFFFDFSTPWNYLGFLRLREAAMRQAARILWRPVSPARLPSVDADQAVTPARERYRQKDLADWARFCGVTLAPSAFGGPVAAAVALRGAAVLCGHPAMAAYVHAVFRRLFEQGLDLPDTAAVLALARDLASLSGDFEDWLARPESAALLDANADDLVRRGGFASPSFCIGADLYVGSDRLPLVELALQERNDFRIVAPGAHSQPRATPGAGK
jgi:2-hydroxychromene-2-carboxylate isomerase